MSIAPPVAALPPRTAPVPTSPEVAPHRDGPDARPVRAGMPWYDGRLVGVLMVAALAIASAVVFTAGILTPWPWGDEGATYLALQRTWGNLPVLFQSPDAPNVPYYFVAKAWAVAVAALWPTLPVLASVRLLSAVAASVTVLTLYALVARRAGRLAGLFAGLVLVSLPGFSRYAQEARTYALLALAATLSWLLSERWLQPRSAPGLTRGGVDLPRRGRTRTRGFLRGVGYTLSLAFLGVLHTFGLFQWPAHVLMAASTPGRARARLTRLAWLALVLVVAAALTVGQVLTSLRYGTGPTGIHRFRVVDARTIPDQLAHGISLTSDPTVSLVVPALAVVGVLCVFVRARRAFVLSLVIWLLVPLVGAITLGALRTNLFRYRYWIAFLPPLAALAGLGLAAIALLPVRLARRTRGGVSRGVIAAAGRAGALAVGGLAAVAVLAVQGWLALPTQLGVRGPTGHGEDLGSALALITSTQAPYPRLTTVFASPVLSGVFAAVHPSLLAGNPVLEVDPGATTVYTSPVPPALARKHLASEPELLWILPGHWNARQAMKRWPADLGPLHKHVVWARPAGPALTAVLLTSSPSGPASG